MRSLNEGQEDHSAQNRGDCGGPPLISAPRDPGESFLAEVLLFPLEWSQGGESLGLLGETSLQYIVEASDSK